MKTRLILMALGLFLGVAHADEKNNCKLTIRTTMKGGKTKVEVLEIRTATRDECKFEAKSREKISDPDEIEKIHAAYGFKEDR